MRKAIKNNLIDILLEANALNAEQVEMIKQESLKRDVPLDALLQELNIVKPDELARAKGRLYGVEYVDLTTKKISQELLSMVTEEVVKNYKFIIFDRREDKLWVALLDPVNMQTIETIDFAARSRNLMYKLFVTDTKSLDAALRQYSDLAEEVGEALKGVGKELEDKQEVSLDLDSEKLSKIVEKAPISQAVSVIIKHAVQEGASDIHIEPVGNEVHIRYRIDGKLKTATMLSNRVLSALISRIKILSGLKLDEHRIPQDGRFQSKINGHQIDFRVSIMPTVNGEKAVMRILDSSTGIQSLEELGLTDSRLQVVKDNIHRSHGMFLVTGPTGSGKSTTLYSILDIINEPSINIVTLEDPVEYFVSGVAQSQVNPDLGFSFASGLRSILRQDPDVLMIGEIRDTETAELAVHASLTGHMVFSTLHTNSSYGAIPRLVDMKIEKFLLVSALNLVVAQRLVRRLCPHCRVKVDPTTNERAIIDKELGSIPVAAKSAMGLNDMKSYQVFHAKGCSKCGGEGYKGRVGIFECLPISDRLQEVILRSASPVELLKVAREEGFMTMLEDGISKVLAGVTTVEEVLRATQG